MSFRNLFVRVLVTTLGLLGAGEAFAARTTTYYHNDGLGSVVAATNDAGQVLWRKDYAPFGEQIDTTPDTERQSYTGKSHDDVTGLTYFGGRYYDPQIARFMSVDPVGFVDNNTMSFNRYLYVNNNPYKYVDPDGEFLNFALKFAFDVAVNVAFNYVTTGEMNVGGALKESALGLLNPAKTLAKAGTLARHMAKARKVENAAAKEMSFAAKANAKSGRTKNKLEPNPDADGPHTSYKRGADGKISGYETYKRSDARNPNPWTSEKRVDVTGAPHYNKVTGKDVPTPHVQGRDIPGGVRPAESWEIPKQ
jgi:RHS repeat-associated protein